jgi:ATP-dependent RNA helicase DHX8/PRP22
VPVSKVAAQQRAGRAGRTAPGKCFRLYSKQSYEQMLDESIPKIRRSNLANTALYLKGLGIHDVPTLELLDRPEEDALLDALEQLFVLDAIDEGGDGTRRGKLMAQFPLEPKPARALLEAIALECQDEMMMMMKLKSITRNKCI